MAWLTPGTALTTPSCTDICVVKTASPFHLGDARKIPEEPLARFDTAMKQSFGSAPNLSLNSAFVHSLMWPAPSMERRPRSPENSLPAWPKESCYFTFCQYHSPVVSFFRPIPLLSIVWMKWVLFPTASIWNPES